MQLRVLGLAASACFAVAAQAAETPPAGKLPRTALPLHYGLQFRVDPRSDTFSGVATLRLKLAEASDHLWLHGQDLGVQQVEISDAAKKPHKGKYSVADAANGVARIDFDGKLPAQELVLRIAYRAPYNRQLEGLYKVQQAGKPYIVTQMEAISARHAFPGFDEPSFKAPIDLVLEIPADDTAVANTAQASEEKLADGWKRIAFKTTPPLPTYLVAFAVGPWDVLDGGVVAPGAWRDAPVPLRGFAPAGQGARLREALDYTPAILTALEDYFGYQYPFGKLDLLAAPDFAAGAMENPGLVVYRDTALLLDARSPVSAHRRSFTITAHELAHQWFGDTVTMPWWDDIWLNESFASWMESRITQQLRPQYRADLSRIEGAQYAMGSDSLASARRIRQPIGDNGDIDGAFDGITYAKGEAVLGMFEAWLGPDVFRNGMRQYVKDHAFANATAGDLVAALGKAGDQGPRFERAMKSFLDQPGVPVVSTHLECKGNKATLSLSQQRYLPLGSAGEAKQQWGVPLCVRVGHGDKSATQCELFDAASGSIALDGGCPDWYLPNADGRGYYRFTLVDADLKKLTAAVGKLSDAEQLAYADAIGAGFDHGDLDAPALLMAMERLAASPQRQVATSLLGNFEWMREHLTEGDARAKLDAWGAQRYLPRLRTLGYVKHDGESEDDALLRGELVEFLGVKLRNAEVRAALLKQGDALIASAGEGRFDYSAVNADLLGSTLTVLVQERGAKAMDAIEAEIARQQEPARRMSLIAALGATRDPALAERARAYAMGDTLKLAETARLLAVNRAQPENRAAYWQWFKDHFDAVLKRTAAPRQGSLPESVVGARCSAAEADELVAFFTPKLPRLTGGAQSLARAREEIGLCAALRQHQDVKVLASWLKRG